MDQRTRIQNISNNFIWTTANALTVTIFPFIVRSLLIRQVGIEYSGVNNLFSSVFQVLNVTELGIGGAVVYYLYHSVGRGDAARTRYLLRLLRRIYRLIGSVIAVSGMILLPFVPYLVKGKEYPAGLNLYVVFVIYIIDAAYAYLTTGYRAVLLQANQRMDLTERAGVCAGICMYVLQIAAIAIFGNYYVYCVLLLLSPVLNTGITSVMARKRYREFLPEIGELEHYRPEDGFRRDFTERVLSAALAKVRNISRNSFDSIIISAFLGLSLLAMYQNYYQIMLVPITILNIMHRSVAPVLGNSVVLEDAATNYEALKIYSFIQHGVVVICTSCLLNLYQPFITLWVGRECLLSEDIVILFCIYFYLMGLLDISELLKETTGVWNQERVLAIVEAAANLILNLVLVQFWGVEGVIIATIVTVAFMNLPVEFISIFRRYFGKNGRNYLKIQAGYAAVLTAACGASYLVCSVIPDEGILWFGLRLIAAVFVPILVLWLIHRGRPEMEQIRAVCRALVKR